MTAYIITPEEHAMLVDALTQWTTPNWAGSGVDQCNAALAMLKAMKPVEPVGWQYKTNEAGLFVSDQCPDDVAVWNDIEWNKPLYAKEQQ